MINRLAKPFPVSLKRTEILIAFILLHRSNNRSGIYKSCHFINVAIGISVRNSAGAHYEIKGEMEHRRRAILKLIEEIKSWTVDPPADWKEEDRLIYEPDRPSR